MLRYDIELLRGEDLIRFLAPLSRLLLDRFRGILSIMVCGSGAKAGLAYVIERDKRELLSDIDIVIICRTAAFFSNSRLTSLVEQHVSQLVGGEVTVAPIPVSVLGRAPRRNYYFELSRALVLSGEDLRHRISVRKASDVDPEDGTSMVFNYLYQLIRVYPTVAQRDLSAGIDALRSVYQIRRCLRGALAGLIVRRNSVSNPVDPRANDLVVRARNTLEGMPDGGQLLRGPWSSVWAMASAESRIDFEPGQIRHLWTRGKNFIEAISEKVGGADTIEGRGGKRDKGLEAIVTLARNAQFAGLAFALGLKPSLRVLGWERPTRVVAERMILRLSNSISERGVDESALVEVRRELARLSPALAENSGNLELSRILADISRVWRCASPALGY